MRRPRFQRLQQASAMALCLAIFSSGCASDRGAQGPAASGAQPSRRRGEDLRLLARLGGPLTLTVLADEWAHQTAARTQRPHEQAVPKTQAWLRCAVDPDPVRAKGPRPDAAPPGHGDTRAGLTADLERALYRLRITTPEGRELTQGVQRCLAVEP